MALDTMIEELTNGWQLNIFLRNQIGPDRAIFFEFYCSIWPDIENKLNKDRERSIEEVAGCRAMLELIYDQGKTFKPLTETTIRGLHHELMRYYQKAGPYIGQYKVQPNSVVETNHSSGERRIVFETAEAGPITEAAMRDLVTWYNEIYPLDSRSIAIACD